MTLALLSSLLWGTGDFLGGRASRRWEVLRVIAWAQLATFLLIWGAVLVGVLAFGLRMELRPVAIGAVGGVAGIVGLAAFYRALALGPMAVVPPIAAAGVVLPVVLGLASNARPTTLVLAGLGLAVLGVLLASVGDGAVGANGRAAQRIAPATLGLCLVAACGFGVIFVALDAAAGDRASTALLATAGARIGSFVTVAVAVALSRARPWRGVGARDAAEFAGIGVLDTSANLLFAIAAARGQLALVAVLGSLYPAVTSGLASLVLGERLGRLQLIGVACALAGVVMLAGR